MKFYLGDKTFETGFSSHVLKISLWALWGDLVLQTVMANFPPKSQYRMTTKLILVAQILSGNWLCLIPGHPEASLQ